MPSANGKEADVGGILHTLGVAYIDWGWIVVCVPAFIIGYKARGRRHETAIVLTTIGMLLFLAGVAILAEAFL